MYVPNSDSVHVGIFANWQGTEEVVDYVTTNKIRVAPISNLAFAPYYFEYFNDFPTGIIDSLLAFAELIADNKLNNLVFNRQSVIYNGETFDVTGTLKVNNDINCYINCGLFVVALLKYYDFNIINIDTWPVMTAANRVPYLEDWLNHQGVPLNERGRYYNMNKQIRGKHIFPAVFSPNRPADYAEMEWRAEELIEFLRLNP